MIKSKKNLLVLLLLFVSLLCMFTATATMGTVKHVKANANFVMENGAAVRVVKGESGIKFIAKVPDPTQGDTKEYRMLIVPEKLLTNKNIEDDFVNELKANYPDQAQNWDTNFWDKTVYPYYDEELSSYVVSGALGVDESRHNEKFCGIAYYMDGNEFVYATHKDSKTIFDNARSISLVSSLALNDADNDFTADEKSILKNYVSSAISASELSFGTEFISAKINSVLDAKINNVSDLDVQYEVGDENVAKVENGAITLIGHGSTTVTAKIGDQFSTSITVDCPTMNQLLADATAKSKQINQYYVMGSVATEADAGAPDGFKDGLKYVLTPSETTGTGNYYGFPVSLNKNNTKSSAYKDFFSVTDWKNAYVTFKVYNAGTVSVEIGLTQGMTNDTHWALSATEKVTVAVGEEKTVCFSIKDAMGLTSSPFETEDFKAGRGFNIQTKNVISGLTADTLVDGAQTLYITDFDIFTPDSTDAMLVRDKKNSEITSQTINRDKTYILEGDTSARFVYNNDGWNGEWYYLTPSDTANYAISSWENVYVSFYVYSTDVLRFNFRYSVDKEEQVQTNVAGEWTKITCSLRELGITSIDDLNSTKLRCRVATSSRVEHTFYVDKFMVESVDISDLNTALVNFAEGDSNVTAEVITDAEYLRAGSQSAIKYTYTNDGVDRGYYNNSKGSANLILDKTSILFELNEDKITDWENAYVGFYVKTTSCKIRFAPRFQTATGEGSSKNWEGTVLYYEWYQAFKDVQADSSSWQYVEMSLKEIAEGANNMNTGGSGKGKFNTENVTDFRFCLAVYIESCTEVGSSATFYIDGLSIYNK